LQQTVADALLLGTPILLMDVDNTNNTLAALQQTPGSGVIIIGMPYQVQELNREVRLDLLELCSPSHSFCVMLTT